MGCLRHRLANCRRDHRTIDTSDYVITGHCARPGAQRDPKVRNDGDGITNSYSNTESYVDTDPDSNSDRVTETNTETNRRPDSATPAATAATSCVQLLRRTPKSVALQLLRRQLHLLPAVSLLQLLQLHCQFLE